MVVVVVVVVVRALPVPIYESLNRDRDGMMGMDDGACGAGFELSSRVGAAPAPIYEDGC